MLEVVVVVVGGGHQEAWEKSYCLCASEILGGRETRRPNHTMLEQEDISLILVQPCHFKLRP